MLKTERFTSTYMGIISCLFDDFFDLKGLDRQEIKELMNRENAQQKIAEVSLFEYFRNRILKNIKNYELLNEITQKIYFAQVGSQKQKSNELNENDLKNITFNKGGYSFIFYALPFFNELNETEQNAIFNMGALYQLENDIFDVYTDNMNGVKTLITEALHISIIKKIYNSQLQVTISAFKKLPYKSQNIQKFLINNLLIISRGEVCLNQLQKLADKTAGKFCIENYSRKELICDMEKMSNIFAWIKSFLKMTKLIIVVPS
ncbi:MAG: hypothetical protein GXO79_01430 [Chlorobi bacterium]|nr:hypothetical protein [Chlorobiota bacterium]